MAIDTVSGIKNWQKQVLIGSLLGGAFIVLNLLTGIAIGFPVLPYSTVLAKYGVVGVLAPVGEELAFRMLIPYMLSFLATPVIFILSAGVFSLFHYYAYGASLGAMNASFIGAFLFGIVALYFTLKYKSPIIAIVLHAIFNIWLVTQYFVTIGGI